LEELYNLEISENTIKSMLEINPEIKELTNNEIIEKKQLLKSIGCSNIQITDIISSNPNYLTKINEEVIKLINYLKELKFTTLNILFDSNPYILDLEPFEIERYIENRKNNGEKLEDIVDDLDSNPYLFSDI
jgi:hypothetical protein